MADDTGQEMRAAELTSWIFAGCTLFVLIWLFLEYLLEQLKSNSMFHRCVFTQNFDFLFSANFRGNYLMENLGFKQVAEKFSLTT